jgi:hypothetical protein
MEDKWVGALGYYIMEDKWVGALGYYIMESGWVGGSGLLHHGEWMGRGLWATTSWRING